jgi:hypothetical protein
LSGRDAVWCLIVASMVDMFTCPVIFTIQISDAAQNKACMARNQS